MTKTIVVVLLLSLAIVFVGSVLVALLQMLPTDETFEPPTTKERDITIGKDQFVGERLAGLRKLQAQREQERDEEGRRALDRVKRGW